MRQCVDHDIRGGGGERIGGSVGLGGDGGRFGR